MLWTLQWSFVAEHHDLREVHWRAAGRLCGALLLLAETGQGAVFQIDRGDPNRFVLRVSGAEARLFVDTPARTIWVVRVRRAA